MPYRSITTIEGWLLEFELLGYPAMGEYRVLSQDGAGGADTGLVSIQLNYAPTQVYIQPAQGSPTWEVTFEPIADSMTLGAASLAGVAAELATVSALCAFLQAKSAAFAGTDEG